MALQDDSVGLKILLMDTCGLRGSVALADDTGVRGTARLGERRASEELVPAVRRLLDEVGWRVSDLGAVGVVRGPGSFTGVRTGWSVGKGICEALNIPLVGVSRLEVMARSAGLMGVVCAVLDAGRGQFYVGRFRGGMLEWQGLAGREAIVAGDGRWVGCEARVIEELGIDAVKEPEASDALELVREGLARGSNDVLDDALYLRRTDAEIFAKPTAKPAEQQVGG